MTGYGPVTIRRGKRWKVTAKLEAPVVTFPPTLIGTSVTTSFVICDEEGVVCAWVGGRMTVWPRARVSQLRSAAAWWADYWNARRPFSV